MTKSKRDACMLIDNMLLANKQNITEKITKEADHQIRLKIG